METDKALHRSLASTLPAMPDAEMREALSGISFSGGGVVASKQDVISVLPQAKIVFWS
jgi:hypothetical protein